MNVLFEHRFRFTEKGTGLLFVAHSWLPHRYPLVTMAAITTNELIVLLAKLHNELLFPHRIIFRKFILIAYIVIICVGV